MTEVKKENLWKEGLWVRRVWNADESKSEEEWNTFTGFNKTEEADTGFLLVRYKKNGICILETLLFL